LRRRFPGGLGFAKGQAKTLAKGEDLGQPNGLVWSGAKLWVVTFGTGEIYSLDESGKKADSQKLPKGMLDGIVALADGSYLVSSWEASAVYRGKPGGEWSLVLGDLRAPADIGYDSERNRILVPLSMDSAVQATAGTTALGSDTVIRAKGDRVPRRPLFDRKGLGDWPLSAIGPNRT
jgi:hypothetical protein